MCATCSLTVENGNGTGRLMGLWGLNAQPILTLMLTRRTFLQLMAASTGAAMTGSELLSQAAARATTVLSPNGSGRHEHVVVEMMGNLLFDHLLRWLPGPNRRTGMVYLATDGDFYPKYPVPPDFPRC